MPCAARHAEVGAPNAGVHLLQELLRAEQARRACVRGSCRCGRQPRAVGAPRPPQLQAECTAERLARTWCARSTIIRRGVQLSGSPHSVHGSTSHAAAPTPRGWQRAPPCRTAAPPAAGAQTPAPRARLSNTAPDALQALRSPAGRAPGMDPGGSEAVAEPHLGKQLRSWGGPPQPLLRDCLRQLVQAGTRLAAGMPQALQQGRCMVCRRRVRAALLACCLLGGCRDAVCLPCQPDGSGAAFACLCCARVRGGCRLRCSIAIL